MSTKKTATTYIIAIHSWYDASTNQWTVSHVDSAEEEAYCVGGHENQIDAWESAREEAEALAVPAIELDGCGRVTDRWEPRS